MCTTGNNGQEKHNKSKDVLTILNVRLPFMEALEQVSGDDVQIVGAVCGDNSISVGDNGCVCINGVSLKLKANDLLYCEWYVVVNNGKTVVE